jgi:hypothetical protein
LRPFFSSQIKISPVGNPSSPYNGFPGGAFVGSANMEGNVSVNGLYVSNKKKKMLCKTNAAKKALAALKAFRLAATGAAEEVRGLPAETLPRRLESSAPLFSLCEPLNSLHVSRSASLHGSTPLDSRRPQERLPRIHPREQRSLSRSSIATPTATKEATRMMPSTLPMSTRLSPRACTTSSSRGRGDPRPALVP